ncbi:MAG: hypothetical protein ACOCUQ_03950 [Bacteroidota bacterium]
MKATLKPISAQKKLFFLPLPSVKFKDNAFVSLLLRYESVDSP